MRTVGADQREERGQEATTIRTKAFHDQVMEFIDFHPDKSGAKQPGQRQPETTLAFCCLYMAIAAMP